MLSIRAIACSIAVAVALSACAPRRSPQTSAEPRSGPRSGPASVLLISLDAFRADYLERGLTPSLSQIVREGVRAEWMTPSYPSLTFPNHYTIVTGLYADHHGIVHNTMRDSHARRLQSQQHGTPCGNGAWWGGEPVWVSAEQAGLPTATYFWPGSEAEIRGVRPTRTTVYDGKVPVNERIDTVLGWLSESVATRPRFVTLYLETLDDAGHGYGPDSVELRTALRVVDDAMGRLVDGLAARSLLDEVNIIITSDHGLAPVAPGNTVAIEDMVDPRDAAVVTTGQSVGFTPQPGREREAYARLVGAHDHYECWRKEDLPKRWHYGTHPRVPAIVCQMQEGWDAGLAGVARETARLVRREVRTVSTRRCRRCGRSSSPAVRRFAVVSWCRQSPTSTSIRC